MTDPVSVIDGSFAEAATLPPSGLPGLDPAWSRLVTAPDVDGLPRTWHVLDRGPREGAALTLLCVHGNPTWSYLWRRVLSEAPAHWRVVAVDQLDMGFSERTGRLRRLGDRIADLAGLTATLGIDGDVVTLAHDWGGPVSLGWAQDHASQVRGVVLFNTAVSQPPTSAAPRLIRLARTPALLRTVTMATPAFVRGTTALSRPRPPREVRDAFAAPYGEASRRVAVQDFVADIPLEPDHPSMPALEAVAARLALLQDVPVLLAWGPSDPVFSDVHLDDLARRLPHADVHRYLGASHLVTEDAPAALADALTWIAEHVEPPGPAEGGRASLPADDAGATAEPPTTTRRPMDAALRARAGDPAAVCVELGPDGPRRRISWARLVAAVDDVAAGLAASGVRPGQRVASLVPPGADLLAVVYACWRLGAVVVAADSGLGPRGLVRAVSGAAPDHLVASREGLVLARAQGMRVPGLTVVTGGLDARARRLLGCDLTLREAAERGREALATVVASPQGGLARGLVLPEPPGADAEAVVVFTSGATGPAKGVVYRHRQLEAQRDALLELFAITGDDALVAAFTPWSVLGPALGIASAIPDVHPTRPGRLPAAALAAAVAAVDATLVWASPATLRSVIATAAELSPGDRAALQGVRLLMSAGAPVPAALLRGVGGVVPRARLHTPYGMTEALPVADIDLAGIEAAGEGDGVCVGLPVPGVVVRVSPLDAEGRADADLTEAPGVVGEICVSAPHVKDRYDRLWATERDASRTPGWHRTGDVGHLDAEGRLWVGGRLAHVVVTADGVITPVGVEHRVEALPQVRAAAVVGVGPRGTQALVVVVETPEGAGRGPADVALTQAVRAVAGVPVAAVLTTSALPVDKRHNSKVDRTAVAAWAERVLAGRGAR